MHVSSQDKVRWALRVLFEAQSRSKDEWTDVSLYSLKGDSKLEDADIRPLLTDLVAQGVMHVTDILFLDPSFWQSLYESMVQRGYKEHGIAYIHDSPSDTLRRKIEYFFSDSYQWNDHDAIRFAIEPRKFEQYQASLGVSPQVDNVANHTTVTEVVSNSPPVFNANSGQIAWNGRTCQVPLGTNQYALCKFMFAAPIGTRVTETDIRDAIDWVAGDEHDRSVYDAVRAVNSKIETTLDVKNFFRWQRNTIWISLP